MPDGRPRPAVNLTIGGAGTKKFLPAGSHAPQHRSAVQSAFPRSARERVKAYFLRHDVRLAETRGIQVNL